MAKKITLNRIISANVACEMRLQKMSVADFIRRVGISKASYHNKMQGRTAWTDENIERIGKAFDLPISMVVTTRREDY